MKRKKRISEMTAAVQRFRRRVIAMLDARTQALESLYTRNDEITAAKRVTADIRNRIGDLR